MFCPPSGAKKGISSWTNMFKEDLIILKEHIYIKRRQFDADREMNASLAEEYIILHVDFAESYRNYQQDAIQSAYFGNQIFGIFTTCCYTKPVGSGDLQNDGAVVVAESYNHSRVASMTCLK